jgi:hypothetical protein
VPLVAFHHELQKIVQGPTLHTILKRLRWKLYRKIGVFRQTTFSLV